MDGVSPSLYPSLRTGTHATPPNAGGGQAFDGAGELPLRRVGSWTASAIARSPAQHSRADRVRRATLSGRDATHYSSSRGSDAGDCGRATRGMTDRGSCKSGSPASAPPVPATGGDAFRQCGRARFPATSAGGRPSGPLGAYTCRATGGPCSASRTARAWAWSWPTTIDRKGGAVMNGTGSEGVRC